MVQVQSAEGGEAGDVFGDPSNLIGAQPEELQVWQSAHNGGKLAKLVLV